MKKFLLTMLCCVMAVCGYAQQVTLDFTNPVEDWNLPLGSSNKVTSGTFTNGTYTITFSSESEGIYAPSTKVDGVEVAAGYLLFGKANSVLTLPIFDFNVGTIEIVGRTGASTAVVQNIYVGDTEVSTATTGAAGTNVYAIASGYQAAGTSYALKVTSKHNTQIVTINIYEAGCDVPETPTETVDISNTPETAYTTTKAVELINAGEGLSTEVYVKGTVSSEPEFNEAYGDMNYYITDGTTEFYIYNGYNLGGNKFTSADDLQDGDEVIVYGKLTSYNNTPEMARGNKLYSLNGKTDSGETPVTPTDDITNTPETAYTPAQANAYCEAGYTTAVYVKGIITSIKSIDVSKYERAQYYIGETVDATETFYIYNGYYLEGKAFTSDDQIKVGDEVVVYGNLAVFGTTNEMAANNYIYSLNGKTKADDSGENPGGEVEVTGDGTLDNPYTVDDVIALYNSNTAPTEAVWVKGVILGNVNTQTGETTVPSSAEEAAATNLSIGDDDSNLAVQLPKGDIRTALNIVDNFDNIGKTVWVYGVIAKYCGVAGVKTVTDYSWDGVNTDIKSVNSDNDATMTIYNVAGQRLSAPQKGVNIINGKKVLVK